MAQKKKKKYTRRTYSDELKAAGVARAQVVGPSQAARELGLPLSIVSMWARRAGVPVASFRGARIPAEALAAAGPPPSLPEAAHPRSAPDTWSRKSKFPHELRLALVREALTEGQSAVARRHGMPSNTLSNWVHRYKDEAIASGNPIPRQVEMTPPPGHRVEDDIREALSSTGTQLSRPEPSTDVENSVAMTRPRRGRPPNSSRAEQLPLYREPQRVQAVPVYDEAERAREQAQSELKDSLLRQALKEREAFKTVLDVYMRENKER